MNTPVGFRAEEMLRKLAYAPPAPAAGAPPMDPSMMGMPPAGGAPPMDPSMMGGAPPMDPSMMGMPPAGGAPPMDPSMMGMPPAGGAPPMDPSMMGGAPPIDPSMMGMPPAGGEGGSPEMGMTPDAFAGMEGGGEEGEGGSDPIMMVSREDLRAVMKEILSELSGTGEGGAEKGSGNTSADSDQRIQELEQQIAQLTTQLGLSGEEGQGEIEAGFEEPDTAEDVFEDGLSDEALGKQASDLYITPAHRERLDATKAEEQKHLAVLRRHKGKDPHEWS